MRGKLFYNLLRKIDNRQGSVFCDHHLVERGVARYSDSRLYINDRQIPISSVRNLDPSFNLGRFLIFVGKGYFEPRKAA